MAASGEGWIQVWLHPGGWGWFSKLGFESWGAVFGKHLPRNPTFGISKLGDYGVVSIFKKFTKICIFGIFGIQNGGFGVQNGSSKLGF